MSEAKTGSATRGADAAIRGIVAKGCPTASSWPLPSIRAYQRVVRYRQPTACSIAEIGVDALYAMTLRHAVQAAKEDLLRASGDPRGFASGLSCINRLGLEICEERSRGEPERLFSPALFFPNYRPSPAMAASMRSRAFFGNFPVLTASRLAGASPTVTRPTMPIPTCGVHLTP